ncbi:DUF4405 domain-containing protein [Pseudodesulfovibrio cashew]|uniref:DUF4405 domain-containing protein n=1 Tax=Pseudodesulfovibrio cashew TaxID=2678688 RepID=A0A6I6JHY5_9BACT|nr:DUF4405 domain-containing protein [Pseudodesulfovibrio cashew]QGY40093.1 DUF4405 domain-containing protein [Pseudodesulfovibrio cashew]
MLRKITSLTSFLSFIVTLITSVVLYIIPQGRVAYWANWHLMGLSKDQWDDIHITVGTLFVVALLLHIWLNWKPIMAYMKNRARELVVLTPAMVVSVVLTLFVTVGTLFDLPPMKQLLDVSASIKDDAVNTYGNPPYGHAELSPLKKFCGFLGYDADKALAALKAAGYGPDISLNSRIKDIAATKGVSPQMVLNAIRGDQGGDPFLSLPANPPEGTGRLKLTDLAKSFGLPMDKVLSRLAAKSIQADETMTMKEIGNKNGLSPKEVYGALRAE